MDCNSMNKNLSNISCISECELGKLPPRAVIVPEYYSLGCMSKAHGNELLSL